MADKNLQDTTEVLTLNLTDWFHVNISGIDRKISFNNILSEISSSIVTVSSVFGRTGDVVAASGDYNADQVDYDNGTSGLSATDVQAALDEIVSVMITDGYTGDVDINGVITTINGSNEIAIGAFSGAGISLTDGTNTTIITSTSITQNGKEILPIRLNSTDNTVNRDTTTTLVNDFSAGSGGLVPNRYTFEGMIFFNTASATPNLKYRLNFTGAGAIADYNLTQIAFRDGEATPQFAYTNTYTDEMIVTLDGSNPIAIMIRGSFRVTGSVMTEFFQWAQNVSDAATVSRLPGSYLSIKRADN